MVQITDRRHYFLTRFSNSSYSFTNFQMEKFENNDGGGDGQVVTEQCEINPSEIVLNDHQVNIIFGEEQ